MNDILIVADMADLKQALVNPKFKDMEFMFSCRDGKKMHCWVPDKIYISDRAYDNVSDEVRDLVSKRRAQGSKICLVS